MNYITKEGLEKLRIELQYLEGVERLKIIQQIVEARDKGDLSENAEYDAAKEAQGFLEMKIIKLKDQIANCKIINPSMLSSTKISILSKVKLKNLADNELIEYTLVPESETNLRLGKISVNTPIAKGLIGKSIGEIAEINLPNGNKLNLEIMEINLSE